MHINCVATASDKWGITPVVSMTKGWFTLYVTFPFRRGTSPFGKIFSCVFKRRCSHWEERLRHVSVPFRRRRRARMFGVTERIRTGLNLPDSDNVNSPASPPLYFGACLQRVLPVFSSESGSPDEPAIQRNRVCDANSASTRASESAQLNSSTSSNMATYYLKFTSELNM
jgi:hypothetical protein